MSKSLLALAMACFVAGSGCSSPSIHRAVRQDLPIPKAWPKLLSVYMPWFGNHVHKDVGYSSNDPVVLRRQIQQARHMGISAFVVDWYGESRPFNDHNFALMQEAAAENHFQVALLYNEAEDDNGQATDEAIATFDKAYRAYIGPEAPHRGAYLTYNGHPMIFVFPKHGHVDWNRLAEHCQGWDATPLFFYKDEPPPQFAADFAGLYAWVQPGRQGWKSDGSNWGEQYLEDFYRKLRNKYPDKIAVGAAWPGFDDSSAKWGLNRHMQSRCGKTLNDTMRVYGQFYDDARPLPFLMIETWNDYEEGTAVERLNFTQCAGAAGTAPSGSNSE
ncbi:MAG TPA: hypothetical protein VFE61_18945 [Candidatus Sulfotelmatobacter sp.]|nr:hypothetical protein [Candidatus Sulfotelmatobacter sp.]